MRMSIIATVLLVTAVSGAAQPLKKIIEEAQSPAIDIDSNGVRKAKRTTANKDPAVELEELVQTQTAAIRELKSKLDFLENRVKLLEARIK